MTTQQVLETRKKDIPTIDEITTILWTAEMGDRMAIVRMKSLNDQKELALKLGVNQSLISRIEMGHLRVSEKFTVKQLKQHFGAQFAFIVFGANPERYNFGSIHRTYWDTRLRIRRKNKGKNSTARFY